jgi:hypothetical protein
MVTKKQKNLKAIEITNKRENLGQVGSHCLKFLKDGLI